MKHFSRYIYLFLVALLAVPVNGRALAPWRPVGESASSSEAKRLDLRFREMVSQLKLSKIEFFDGGGAYTNGAPFVEEVIQLGGNLKLEDPGVKLPKLESLNPNDLPRVDSLDKTLDGYEFHLQLGRTLVFKHVKNKTFRAIKVLKEKENPGLLKYESE